MFKALTLAEVEIADYPFTTIDANVAVGYVRTKKPLRKDQMQTTGMI